MVSGVRDEGLEVADDLSVGHLEPIDAPLRKLFGGSFSLDGGSEHETRARSFERREENTVPAEAPPWRGRDLYPAGGHEGATWTESVRVEHGHKGGNSHDEDQGDEPDDQPACDRASAEEADRYRNLGWR